MTNRRSFLAALAAPLIARPTLEDIERLTWCRKYWPGWSAPLARHLYEVLRYGVSDVEGDIFHFGCFGDIDGSPLPVTIGFHPGRQVGSGVVHETSAGIYADLYLSPEIQTGNYAVAAAFRSTGHRWDSASRVREFTDAKLLQLGLCRPDTKIT